MILTLLKRFWPELVVIAIVALVLRLTWSNGYDTHRAEVDKAAATQMAKQAERRIENLTTDTKAAIQSDATASARVQRIEQGAQTVKTQLRAHLKPPAPASPQSPDTPTLEVPHETLAQRFGRTDLDLGTVRLLNRAADLRADADPGAAQPVDGALESLADTASGLTGADLAEHDIEVKAQYQELATKHDALVDYVEQLCARHACVRVDKSVSTD
jgi:hypothetical protein